LHCNHKVGNYHDFILIKDRALAFGHNIGLPTLWLHQRTRAVLFIMQPQGNANLLPGSKEQADNVIETQISLNYILRVFLSSEVRTMEKPNIEAADHLLQVNQSFLEQQL